MSLRWASDFFFERQNGKFQKPLRERDFRCQAGKILDYSGFLEAVGSAKFRQMAWAADFAVKLKIRCPRGRVGSTPTTGIAGPAEWRAFCYAGGGGRTGRAGGK